jgi:hypothetical protein
MRLRSNHEPRTTNIQEQCLGSQRQGEQLAQDRKVSAVDICNMTMPFRPRWYFFIALVSITFIGPLSIHLFIPAMPAVKEAFRPVWRS